MKNENKNYLDNDDYRRISKDIVRLISQNHVSYRDAKTLMKCVICEMEEQMVQIPPLGPIYDNPNCIIRVGDVFGFIISIENVL